jgi:hypothetical protein
MLDLADPNADKNAEAEKNAEAAPENAEQKKQD